MFRGWLHRLFQVCMAVLIFTLALGYEIGEPGLPGSCAVMDTVAWWAGRLGIPSGGCGAGRLFALPGGDC